MLRNKIRCFSDLSVIPNKNASVVTLFSGGLDSSYLLSILYELGFSQVTALCIDLGESIPVKEISKTADRFNAELVIIDRKKEFAEEYVKPALKCQAKYLDIFPVSSSLARPLIARCAVEIAKQKNALAILHTANQSQNSLRRLNNSISYNNSKLFYGSPYEYDAITREEKAKALSAYGLTYYAGRKLSGDSNIWCREFESGPLDNPENFEIPEDAFVWSSRKKNLSPMLINIEFEAGELISVDGQRMEFVDAIKYLNNVVGQFGYGRYVGLEHLDEGEKVLEVREAPAAFILMQALRHLETASLSANAIAFKQIFERTWTLEAVEGHWYSDTKKSAEAGIFSLTNQITGSVTFKINYDFCLPTSIKSNNPLYITDRDSWEIEIARLRRSRSIQDLKRNSGNLNSII